MSSENKNRLAVFGGSFNPVHLGHIALANEAIERDLTDEVLFVPAAQPPHKVGQELADASHRLNMLEKALADYPDFSWSDYEIENSGQVSYTIFTLRALKAAYPKKQIQLIIGMDNFVDLHNWRSYQEILDNHELIIFTRPDTAKAQWADVNETFGHRYTEKLLDSIIEVDYDISSTEIRERLANEAPISDLVPSAVAEYISENKLYGEL